MKDIDEYNNSRTYEFKKLWKGLRIERDWWLR